MKGWLAVGLVLAAMAPVSADVVVLTPTRDNTIFDNGNSNGAGDAIFSGRTGDFGGQIVQRGLVAFRVAGSVPAGSTITSVSLELALVQTGAMGSPASHSLHRVLADWGEGESIFPGGTGAPPTAGDATWDNTFFPDQFWLATGGDYSPTVSASQTIGPALGSYTWGSTPQMVADVQIWLDIPSTPLGWLLMGDEVTPFSAKKFASREAVDSSLHPTLTIEFTPPPCPADCGDGDGIVAIVDFLALLGQSDAVGSSCDFGLGAQGVGIEEFLDLLANWGPCP